MDFSPFPRQNKSQILSTDLLIKNENKIKKERKKIGFSLGNTISIKDIMSTQSTGRRRINLNEQ